MKLPKLTKNLKLPHKRSRRQPATIAVVIAMAAFGLLLIGGGIVAFLLYVPAQLGDSQTVRLTIAPNSSVEKIAQQLESQRLIRSSLAFRLYVGLSGQQGKLQPGTYLVNPNQSAAVIAGDMASGRFAKVNFTVPEGYTLRDTAARYAKLGLGSSEEFMAAAQAAVSDPFVKSTGATTSIEGLLQPATYQFGINDTAADVVATMLGAFQKQNWQLLATSTPPAGLSRYQALTMASVIEKEAQTAADRKLAAGVFYNRLSRGMKLESDVTINYVTGKTATEAADLKLNSSYNSYLNPGLPPTPVCNPDASAIAAVLQPSGSDFLFFIADSQNRLHFAKNLTEHNENIRKYLNN